MQELHLCISQSVHPDPKCCVVFPLQQTSMSLSSDQPPPSTALPPASQTQVFQPVSKVPHSSGINVNAAPFQSMQTVRLQRSFLFLKLNTKQVSCCKTMPMITVFKMMIFMIYVAALVCMTFFSSPADIYKELKLSALKS